MIKEWDVARVPYFTATPGAVSRDTGVGVKCAGCRVYFVNSGTRMEYFFLPDVYFKLWVYDYGCDVYTHNQRSLLSSIWKALEARKIFFQGLVTREKHLGIFFGKQL